VPTHNYYTRNCHDLGSEICPCVLAERGSCIICPVLNEQGTCDDCKWNGICIYDLALKSKYENKNDKSFICVDIFDKRRLSENLYSTTIALPQRWLPVLSEPGSYVLLKAKNSEEISATPMAICSVDPSGESTVIFEKRGYKTDLLTKSENELEVCGPHAGALFGSRRLNDTFKSDVLILVSNTGQSLLPNILQRLNQNECHLNIILDPGQDCMVYVLDLLPEFDGSLQVTRFGSKRGELDRLANILRRKHPYDMVISLGSDRLHHFTGTSMRPDKWVASNNQIMVCGRGICGSCNLFLDDGSEVRGCKGDVAPEDVFWQFIRDKWEGSDKYEST